MNFKANASLFEKLTDHFRSIKTMKGNFTQITIFPDGDRKIFEGTFYIIEGKSRWDYKKPEKQIIITQGNKIFIFDVEEKTLQEGEIGNTIFLSGNLVSDIKKLENNYVIKERDNKLYLYPLNKEGNIDTITIKLDNKLNISEIITIYKTGERIILNFSQIDYNVKIKSDIFSLKNLLEKQNVY